VNWLKKKKKRLLINYHT